MLGNVKMYKGKPIGGYEYILFEKTDGLVHLASILKDELNTIKNASTTRAEMVLLAEEFLKDEISQLEYGSSEPLKEKLEEMLSEFKHFLIDVEEAEKQVENDPVLAKLLAVEIEYTKEILKNDFIFMLKDRIETTIKEMLRMLSGSMTCVLD